MCTSPVGSTVEMVRVPETGAAVLGKKHDVANAGGSLVHRAEQLLVVILNLGNVRVQCVDGSLAAARIVHSRSAPGGMPLEQGGMLHAGFAHVQKAGQTMPIRRLSHHAKSLQVLIEKPTRPDTDAVGGFGKHIQRSAVGAEKQVHFIREQVEKRMIRDGEIIQGHSGAAQIHHRGRGAIRHFLQRQAGIMKRGGPIPGEMNMIESVVFHRVVPFHETMDISRVLYRAVLFVVCQLSGGPLREARPVSEMSNVEYSMSNVEGFAPRVCFISSFRHLENSTFDILRCPSQNWTLPLSTYYLS